MSVLTFTEYIEPTTTANGKITPPKAKAGDKTYALAKATVELIRNSLGTPLECETKSEQNGKWWNHSVLSAKHVVAADPVRTQIREHFSGEHAREPLVLGQEGAPHLLTPTAQGGQPPTPAAPAWLPEHDKQRLIVRQSSIKAAVDLVVAGKAPAGLWETAELIESWVWKNADPEPKTVPWK